MSACSTYANRLVCFIFTFTHTQGFLTDHEQALETLYAEDADKSRHFDICLNMMATRIATVFASLKVNFLLVSLCFAHTGCLFP